MEKSSKFKKAYKLIWSEIHADIWKRKWSSFWIIAFKT